MVLIENHSFILFFLAINKSTLCNYVDDNTFYTSGNEANVN